MRIRCFFKGEEPLPYVSGVARCRSPRVHGRITFLVDTGSNITLISEPEARRLHIPYDRLKRRPQPIRGVGGYQDCYFLGGLEFQMGTDEGVKVFELPQVGVLRTPQRAGKQTQAAASLTPNIMGMDFLRGHRLALFCDPAGRIAYLEAGGPGGAPSRKPQDPSRFSGW